MLILQGISYTHPDKDVLFTNINIAINRHHKIALIGNNGAGKSILLKIAAGILQPSSGFVKTDIIPYYIPQHFGQFNEYSVAEALNVAPKLKALKEILQGNVTEANMALLGDDWAIEERCREALAYWQLSDIDLWQKMVTLSGGQKTKVFLAGIIINQPTFVLLDEPSNHLDLISRGMLYDYIKNTTDTLVVVSHDRTLLNLLDTVYELDKRGITAYGGNYDFYKLQKDVESGALNEDVRNTEKTLRKAKQAERQSLERQQKLDDRGKKKQEKAGLPTISMNTFRNNAEKSTSRLKGIHEDKVDNILHDLQQLRKALPDMDKMRMAFNNSLLHKGKILINAQETNVIRQGQLLWKKPLSIEIRSGERIAIKGANGSGKTTLIKMILGHLGPDLGSIYKASFTATYIDQDYSLVDNNINVYQQAYQYTNGLLQEHEIKIRLNSFLFTKTDWGKACNALSGGEKMRLILCCLTLAAQTPDVIVLDEPTNNLDVQNIEILATAIANYKGTLIAVCHDEYFLNEINVERMIRL